MTNPNQEFIKQLADHIMQLTEQPTEPSTDSKTPIFSKLEDKDKQPEKKSYIPQGITTFEQLDAYNAVNDFMFEMYEMSDNIWELIHNIFHDPMIDDKRQGVMNMLTSAMNRIQTANTDAMQDIKSVADDIIKENVGHKAFKSDGQHYFYCRDTNVFEDREADVLTEKAHREYIAFLDDNPQYAPWLYIAHLKATKHENRACWWAYADGFTHFIYPLTEDENKGIENFIEAGYIPAMSHGFYVLEYEDTTPRQITKYRSFEKSILPVEMAANQNTTFHLVKNGEISMKSFDENTKRLLIDMHGKEYADMIEQQTALEAKELLEMGNHFYKNLNTTNIQKDANMTIPEDQKAPENQEDQKVPIEGEVSNEVDNNETDVNETDENETDVDDTGVNDVALKVAEILMPVIKQTFESLQTQIDEKLANIPTEDKLPTVKNMSKNQLAEMILKQYGDDMFSVDGQVKESDNETLKDAGPKEGSNSTHMLNGLWS